MAGSKKQQVFYIGGGESFLKHDDFLERLKTSPLWHMEEPREGVATKTWTTSLEEDLGNGYQVIMPPMPNKQNAKYQEWKIWFERHFEYLRDGAILIGYSLGAMFLGRYLTEEKLPFAVKSIFLLAGAVPLPEENQTDFGDFLIDLDNVSMVTEKHPKVVIMHSKDDFVVPFHHSEKLAEAIPGAEFIVFKDKNHFLIEEFPELINKIKALT